MPRLFKQAATPPQIDSVSPAAALPGGDVELRGSHLGPRTLAPPSVTVDGIRAHLLMSRSERLAFRVPGGCRGWSRRGPNAEGTGKLVAAAPCPRTLRRPAPGYQPSRQPLRQDLRHHLRPARQADAGLHRAHRPRRVGTPFVSGILNPTGLAFDPEGELYVTSRAEGTVYRIDAGGEVHRLRRRHGHRHRRSLRRGRQSLRRRPQRHHLQDLARHALIARSSYTPRSSPRCGLPSGRRRRWHALRLRSRALTQ